MLVIEHNLDVIKSADHIVDLWAGKEGIRAGKLSQRNAEQVAKEKKSLPDSG